MSCSAVLDLGKNGLISLSTLNGANGFRLDGELPGDYSGGSVGSLGDINGDGLMILYWRANLLHVDSGQSTRGGPGTSYVIFGNKQIGA